ncbi:MAG: energy transducer TonB [Xanthomonadales bacterium]|nr:energy transducer TonB [Xanthomonadales bacterium]
MKSNILTITLGFTLLVSANIVAQELETVLFIPSDQSNDYWLSVKKVAPIYPSRASIKGKMGCATVLYSIEPDGTTSNHRVVVAYPKWLFDRSSIQAAKQFLYEPSEENIAREAVYTSNTFTYQLLGDNTKSNDEKRENLSDKCTDAANKILAEESESE